MQNETAQSTVTLNGAQAKQEMTALTQKANNLRMMLKEANEAGDGKAFEKYNKQLKETTKQMNQMAKEAFDVKKVLNNLSGASIKDLEKAQKQLNATLRSGDVTRNTEEWKTLQEQLKSVKSEIADISSENKVAQGGFSKMAEGANKYMGIFAAGFAAVTGMTLALKGFMDQRLKLEDSQANLKSLTGLGDDDIAWLTEQAKGLATTMTTTGVRIRASSQEIVDAFTIVGSAKPELLKDRDGLKEVTEQALILAEASKMEVGDAVKGITIALNMYGASAKEAARYTNVLGAGAKEGAAEVSSQTESILKAGVAASQANIPIEQLVGSIQTLAEKGIKDEIAGTGLKTFFIKLQSGADDTNPKIVGLQKALENLAAKQLSSSELQKQFGLETYTVAASMIASADKVKFYTQAVTGTTTALEQAQINSKTTAATLAQAKNDFNELGMALVAKLNPAMLAAANLGNAFLKVLVQMPRWIIENKGLVLTLAAGMVAYGLTIVYNTIAQKASNIEKTIGIYLAKAGTIADLAAAAAKALFTGNITRARAAMRLLNAELLVNPYVAIGVALAAVTVAIYKFATAQTSAEKAWKEFNVQSQIEIQTADQLFEAVKKSNAGSTERKSLIYKINTQYGQYLTNQLTEKSNLDDIAEAQKTVNFALRDKIAIQTKEASKAEVTKKSVDKQVSTSEKLSGAFTDAFGENIGEIMKSESLNRLNADPDNMQLTFHDEKNRLWQKHGYKAQDIIYYLNQYTVLRTELSKELKSIDKKFDGIYSTPFDPLASSLKGEVVISGNKKPEPKRDDSSEVQKTKLDALRKTQLEEVDKWTANEQSRFKKRYLDNLDSEETYQTNLLNITKESLQWKQKLYGDDEKEYTDYKNQLLDIDIKKRDDANKLTEKKNKEALENFKKLHDAELNLVTASDLLQRNKLEQNLADDIITQAQYDDEIIKQDIATAYSRLTIANNYSEDAKNFHYTTEEDRVNTINAANNSALDADKAYRNAKKKLTKDGLEEVREIESRNGINGSKSKSDQYKEDIQLLREKLATELADTKKSAKDKKAAIDRFTTDIKVLNKKNAQDKAQDIIDIASKAGDFSSKLQEAESLSIENKYAVQLNAAKGNADETKAIEEQMEAEKVAVKKKYADIDFALTSAKIIASTSLAVMKAWETGPYAGPALAIITGATGLAELAVANEQRIAVQNLWTGGFTEDGGKYEPRGIVHAGEFVANQEAVRNAPMRKVFNLVDYAQRTNRVAQISSEDIVRSLGIRNGYANGGFVASVPTPGGSSEGGVSKQDLAMMYGVIAQNSKLIAALHGQIQNGIQANVSIAGKNGISEQTTMYNKLLANAQR